MSRAAVVGSVAMLAAACGGGVHQQGPLDGRLNGEWEIALTMLPATPGPNGIGDTLTSRGTLAFVPNRAGTRVPSFGGVPQQVGTHNLRLDRLVPDLDPRTITPIAAASSAGDSVHMVLDPGSDDAIVLRGTWQGPGVSGSWLVHRRAGIDREGRFSLRRPPP